MSPVQSVAGALPDAMPLTAAHYLLALAALLVWLPRVRVATRSWPLWPLAFVAALGVGVFQQVLLPLAAGLLIVLAALLWAGTQPVDPYTVITDPQSAQARASTRSQRIFLALGMMLALAFALHKVPGFTRGLVIPPTRMTPDAAVYSQYLNFDKGAAGVLLLALACRRVEWAADWGNRFVAGHRDTGCAVGRLCSIRAEVSR
jgi:uncharacterized protein